LKHPGICVCVIHNGTAKKQRVIDNGIKRQLQLDNGFQRQGNGQHTYKIVTEKNRLYYFINHRYAAKGCAKLGITLRFD
jgi:hypothetical protein